MKPSSKLRKIKGWWDVKPLSRIIYFLVGVVVVGAFFPWAIARNLKYKNWYEVIFQSTMFLFVLYHFIMFIISKYKRDVMDKYIKITIIFSVILVMLSLLTIVVISKFLK